jgi:Xaa-Pro aminopeptidase
MAERIGGFSGKAFEGRRARAFERLGESVMVLPAAPVLYRSMDTEHRYRPDSELFYLTGCTEPGVVAVLSGVESDPPFTLFVPRPDRESELWSGPRPGPEAAQEHFGADAAFPADELEKRLPEILRRPRRLLFRFGTDQRLDSLVIRALRAARTRGARKGDGLRGVDDPGQILDGLRLRKDPEELARIRRAADLTMMAFRGAMRATRPGVGEWELEGLLESVLRSGGARGPAFPTIVASGGNTCTLHYTGNDRTIRSGDLVLVDGGGEVDLYAADVSRTFPADGRFDGPQRDVYEAVLKARKAALAEVRPGHRVGKLHAAAILSLTEDLLDLGVLSGRVDDLLEEKAYECHFPHQTSHWLGLDVHDVGDYVTGGDSRVLEEGMVLTIEPGLYFPVGKEPPGPFTGLGVRIEDDVLVTTEGAENLTDTLPVTPEQLEEILGTA